MVIYTRKKYKTCLNKLKFPDSWFWARYTINPYSGCEHACIYCDARSNRYYLEQDFENEIIIKNNVEKLLEERIKRARKLLPDVVAAGGINDAYQQIEKKAQNTRRILQVIVKYKFPINIATKSKLIIRDIDLFNKISQVSWATIGFSITTTNEELAKFLEPHSSSPKERLDAISAIKKKAPDVQVGTYFMPIIPFLEDDEDNLENVISNSKKAGADFILFSPGLTMRDSQKEFFIRKLRKSKYKNVVNPLLDLYGNKTYPPLKYINKLHPKLLKLCRENEIAVRIRRWIPSDYRKWNYKISEILLNKEYMQMVETGKSDNNMKWAGLHLNNLEESILNVYKRGDLLELQNFSESIVKIIIPYLEKYEELQQKMGLDKFL
ncbi:MAG: radical SAM protein [Promethearchaeota archaeon]|nr:MAG: radical SAM protein [Candidatus Lokiarchaeota archaeon]